MQRFKEHGKFEIKRGDQLLFLDATGPFNGELITMLMEGLQEHVDALSPLPWAEVAIMREESAYTPEALVLLTQSIAKRIEQNLRAIAIQFDNPTSRQLTEYQLTTVFSQFKQLSFAFFDSNEDAKDWCLQQLAHSGN
jgi:hypothetical protein|tara:strand:- start:1831 stop:2244 length:414 start_codon:yes stop_codon:yes gene_type:complete